MNTPTSPAQWLYGVLRALPGERIRLVTVARGIVSASLAPATGVRTTRLGRTLRRFRPACSRMPDAKASITIPVLRFVTIAKRPSCGPGCATYTSDLPNWASKIILIWGLDIDSANQKALSTRRAGFKSRASHMSPSNPSCSCDPVHTPWMPPSVISAKRQKRDGILLACDHCLEEGGRGAGCQAS